MKKKKAATRKRAAKRTGKRVAKKGARRPEALTLGEPQLRWLDSFIESVVASGGPRLRREDVVHALIDANTARSIDPRAIRNLESLRVAFGAMDMSAVERRLDERPKLEPSLLAALKDSIK